MNLVVLQQLFWNISAFAIGVDREIEVIDTLMSIESRETFLKQEIDYQAQQIQDLLLDSELIQQTLLTKIYENDISAVRKFIIEKSGNFDSDKVYVAAFLGRYFRLLDLGDMQIRYTFYDFIWKNMDLKVMDANATSGWRANSNRRVDLIEKLILDAAKATDWDVFSNYVPYKLRLAWTHESALNAARGFDLDPQNGRGSNDAKQAMWIIIKALKLRFPADTLKVCKLSELLILNLVRHRLLSGAFNAAYDHLESSENLDLTKSEIKNFVDYLAHSTNPYLIDLRKFLLEVEQISFNEKAFLRSKEEDIFGSCVIQ